MVGPESQQSRIKSYVVWSTGFWIFINTKKYNHETTIKYDGTITMK